MNSTAHADRFLRVVVGLLLGFSSAVVHAAASSQDSPTMNQTHTSSRPSAEALSVRQQAIIPIAALGAAGDMVRLGVALNRGLDAGMTVNDAKKVLVQLYAYAGFPWSLNALRELLKVVEGRKKGGINDVHGQTPGRAIPRAGSLLAAGTGNQTKLVGSPVNGALFEFAPAADQYLETHPFGDIFERENLDWPSREIATVGMLSALQGADSQHRAHIGMSMNAGVCAAQLRQLVQVLADKVDAETAGRAGDALKARLLQSGSR